MKRCFLVVIDSLGVGEAPDAKQYGDKGVNTLGNVAKHVQGVDCLLYTSPSPRDVEESRMPSSA